MASAENSSGLSGRGLKGMLAKARRNKQDNNSSTTSFNGTEGSTEGHGIRESMDSALDKLKAVAKGDSDNPASPGLAGITKLMSGTRKRRETKRRALGDGGAGERRGRPIGNGEGAIHTGLDSQSASTIDDDGESSLMTDDSVEDE
jgi:hypothetical protein